MSTRRLRHKKKLLLLSAAAAGAGAILACSSNDAGGAPTFATNSFKPYDSGAEQDSGLDAGDSAAAADADDAG